MPWQNGVLSFLVGKIPLVDMQPIFDSLNEDTAFKLLLLNT